MKFGQKFGVSPKKISAAQNIKFLSRFWTTSLFACAYLRTGTRYHWSESGVAH